MGDRKVIAPIIVGIVLGIAFGGMLIAAYTAGRAHCVQEVPR